MQKKHIKYPIHLVVRGGNFKRMFIALFLPSLFILPFIFILRHLPFDEEWKVWTSIFSFIIPYLFVSVYCGLQFFRKGIIIIYEKEVEVKFNSTLVRDSSVLLIPINERQKIVEKEIFGSSYYHLFNSDSGKSIHFVITDGSFDKVVLFQRYLQAKA